MGRTFKHDRDWGRPKTRYKKPKNKISSPKKDNKTTTFEYELPWHPAGEIKLSEYEELVTYFVQTYIERHNDA